MRCHRRELGRVPGLRAAHGFADEGFGPVADAFKDNFDRGTETGAVGFSITKGLVALAGYLAQQQGLLRFDDPVRSVWPAVRAARHRAHDDP